MHQIENLIRSGYLIAPKPWQIQLVGDEISSEETAKTKISPTKLARKIGKMIRDSPTPLNLNKILERVGKETTSDIDVEEALTLLQLQGYILKTSMGTYRWTGE